MRRFEGMNLLYYLDVAVGMAFVERRTLGEHGPETVKALGVIESLGLHGKRLLLKSQGFLT
jgi:hypothetical protein